MITDLDETEDGPKPTKIPRSELYKPPTREELTNLQETEMLFHSNLVRLQITETLKEISISEKRRKEVDSYLHSLHEQLINIPETSTASLNDLTWLPASVCYPLVPSSAKVKGNMRFLPPVDVKVVGSYLLNTGLKMSSNVDLLLKMPKECMQEKDHLNQRYSHKRAAYLTRVAHHLSQCDLVSDISFSYFLDDPMKPIINIFPAGKLSKFLTVKVHASPEGDHIKHRRLHPLKSNLRRNWFYGVQTTLPDEKSLVPTPHYNSIILMDFLMEQHLQYLHDISNDFQAFSGAVKLLKVWLRQRELNQGYGSFNGFLMSMVVAVLFSMEKITKTMSSYQIVRSVFQYLTTTDWTVQGAHFGNCEDITTFHNHFQVVFIDPSGKLNLCANTSSLLYHQVRHEAELSLKALDGPRYGFNSVFIEPVPFIRKFDQLLQITKTAIFQKTCHKLQLYDRIMDHAGNCLSASLPEMGATLLRGLSKRIHLLSVKPYHYKPWKITESPPSWKDLEECITFGFLLNPDYAEDLLEKGPSADVPEAKSFREFWGDCSDLRRFKDGSICEAVVWTCETIADRRNMPGRICKHVLSRHFDIPSTMVSVVAAQLEMFLTYPRKKLKNGTTVGYDGTGDEINSKVVRVYNDLCQSLNNLETLPLSITNLQGISPVLRYTEVYPPSPSQVSCKLPTITVNSEQLQVPLPGKACPNYVAPIQVLCHMEGSGKWPQDAEALRRLKAAFHIAMADELKTKHKDIACIPTQTHLDVLKDGFVYRISVAYHREIGVLQTHKTDDGMVKIRNTPESLALEKRTVHLPHLSSILHGLYQKHSSFGITCRLAKKWISSQLLSRQFSVETIELLVAHLYVNPQPYTVPSSGQAGFMRFLYFASSFDFALNPIIVDVNNTLSDEDTDAIMNHFSNNRQALPSLCLFTPKDRTRSLWTAEFPNKVVLRRLKDLAKAFQDSLQTRLVSPETDLMPIFTPSLSAYDVIIHLKLQWLPRRHEALSQLRGQASTKHRMDIPEEDSLISPAVDFDPAQLYLSELEQSFSEFALFFHNTYGGSVVGVLWRPQAFKPKPFKISTATCKMLSKEGKSVPNVEAIIEDFKVLGQGLVESIDIRPDKWKI